MSNTLKTISFFLLAVLHSCLLKPEIDKETYYIPDGFTGKVLVLFNCKDGKPKDWTDDGRRLYRIPESGVLKTQFKPNTGSRYEYPKKQIKSLRDYYKFFYVDDRGVKIPLNLKNKITQDSAIDKDSIIVHRRDAIFKIGNHNQEYSSVITYIIGVKSSNLLEYYNDKFLVNDYDWERIRKWNTFDAIKDTIPLLKPQKNK